MAGIHKSKGIGMQKLSALAEFTVSIFCIDVSLFIYCSILFVLSYIAHFSRYLTMHYIFESFRKSLLLISGALYWSWTYFNVKGSFLAASKHISFVSNLLSALCNTSNQLLTSFSHIVIHEDHFLKNFEIHAEGRKLICLTYSIIGDGLPLNLPKALLFKNIS